MASIKYTVTVSGGDVQDFTVTGGGTNQIISEANTDAAVQAFADSMVSTSGVSIVSIGKEMTTITDTTL